MTMILSAVASCGARTGLDDTVGRACAHRSAADGEFQEVHHGRLSAEEGVSDLLCVPAELLFRGPGRWQTQLATSWDAVQLMQQGRNTRFMSCWAI
jgi:hypothetical protein